MENEEIIVTLKAQIISRNWQEEHGTKYNGVKGRYSCYFLLDGQGRVAYIYYNWEDVLICKWTVERDY